MRESNPESDVPSLLEMLPVPPFNLFLVSQCDSLQQAAKAADTHIPRL